MALSKIRRSAFGEECTVRMPCCRWDTETVVLAHIRRPWNAGMGMKPNDTHAVYACAACHDEIDRRTMNLSELEVDSYLVDAILRSHDRMRERGLI